MITFKNNAKNITLNTEGRLQLTGVHKWFATPLIKPSLKALKAKHF